MNAQSRRGEQRRGRRVQRIFITGGGSGIGAATARLFAARGWEVGLADLNPAAIEATAASLPQGLARGFVMDVRDREAFAAALADFAGAEGRIDVMMNNAGIAAGGALAANGWDEIDRVVGVNLMGVVNGAKLAFPYLKAARGCLLNIASAAGIYGGPGIGIYAATKFAVRGLTESLDGEWAGEGVRVRSLMPSFIDTPLLEASVSGTNYSVRQTVTAGGLEITPVATVAEAAWAAVHGTRLHTPVGKTAQRLAFAARWMPGRLRRQMTRRRS